MVALLILVIVLASLGILGSIIEGLLWLTAIAVLLVGFAGYSLWSRVTR